MFVSVLFSSFVANIVANPFDVLKSRLQNMPIRADGTVVSWGSNSYSSLGRSGSANVPEPVTALPSGFTWEQVAVGWYNSYALSDDGTLFGWGYGGIGQMGNGSTASPSTPVRIGQASEWASVEAGLHHVMAIKKDGSLWTWMESSV